MQNKPDIADVAAVVPRVTFREEIGEGGFKVVYRADVNGCVEAAKLARIPVDMNDSAVEETNRRRLRRELDLLARCETPCLVKLGRFGAYDCEIGGYQYVCYSEELIEGECLRARIRTGHQPDQNELATLGVCLLSAIEELAGKDTIHRDIKPDNVMATQDGARPFVLLDLGVAFIVGGTNYTLDTQAIPGTRWYIAPEMLELGFRESLDYRADLYTMGLTMYEYASGANPFADPGDPPLTTMYRIRHQNPPPLRILRADLDTGLCALVDQLIKKIPALRPANLPQLIKRMEGCR
ncbi:MAG: protein kinase [Lentisphaerae bacterium]|nr:protein kinase [Lentisphaerota bacterium]